MKEAKGMRTLFAWVVRLALPLFIYFFDKAGFKHINLTSANDLILLSSLILALLIFLGGFFRGHSLTRISSLVLIIIAIIGVFIEHTLLFWTFPIFGALYFLVYGNNA